METKCADIGEANLEFYEQAALVRDLPGLVLKQLLSYEQQLTTRRSLRMLGRPPNFGRPLSELDSGLGHCALLLRLPRVNRLYGCELSSQAMRNLELVCRFLHRDVNLHSPQELAAAPNFQSLDLVCCSHVIEHMDNDAELFLVLAKKT